MTAPENEKVREFNQALAVRALTRIDENQRISSNQVASASRWLSASILAINGAGAISIVSTIDQGKSHWIAGILFTFGVIFTLFNGVLIQDFYNYACSLLHDQESYWTEVSLTGERDFPEEEALNTKASKPHIKGVLAPAMGWIGGMLFLSGAIVLGFYKDTDRDLNDKRCVVLQDDMLSIHPLRKDGIELFKALGCKPEGSTPVEL